MPQDTQLVVDFSYTDLVLIQGTELPPGFAEFPSPPEGEVLEGDPEG